MNRTQTQKKGKQGAKPSGAYSTDPAPQAEASAQNTAGNQAVQRVLQPDSPIGPIFPKLKVGGPDDPYEREADAVAQAVTGGNPRGTPINLRTQDDRVQRKCAACAAEEEQTVQTKAKGEGGAHRANVQSAIGSAGAGSHLGFGTRARIEPILGRDLSGVRVHTDQRARQANASLNARAFTHGDSIFLGAGESHDDLELMAHEAAHVQQQGAEQTLRRKPRPRDEIISGVHPDSASHPLRIFFNYGSASVPSTEVSKFDDIASRYVGREVKLFGRASEEGDPALNLNLAQRRINAVAARMRHRGVRVYDTEVRLPDAAGQIDYRFQRSVEVALRPLATSADPNPVAQTQQDPCAGPNADEASGNELTACRQAFFEAWPLALTKVLSAYVRLINTNPDPARDALLNTIFTGVSPAVVTNHIRNLLTQVAVAPSVISCRSTCDDSCDRNASMSGTGPTGTLNLCPGFYPDSRSLSWNSQTLIHESTHGTPGLAADDIAYGSTRRFEFLPAAESVRNTDSYTYLILLLASPGSVTIGPTAADNVAALDATTEQPRAREAIAYMEDWLNYCDFDTGLAYSFLLRSQSAWSTGQTSDTLGTTMLTNLAPMFGFSDPTTAPHAIPADQVKMAAVHDRYDRMYDVVNHHALTVQPAAEGGQQWTSAPGLPGAAHSLAVPPSFFTMSLKGRIIFLIQLLARSFTDVSDAYATKYGFAANHIRKYRRLGP